MTATPLHEVIDYRLAEREAVQDALGDLLGAAARRQAVVEATTLAGLPPNREVVTRAYYYLRDAAARDSRPRNWPEPGSEIVSPLPASITETYLGHRRHQYRVIYTTT